MLIKIPLLCMRITARKKNRQFTLNGHRCEAAICQCSEPFVVAIKTLWAKYSLVWPQHSLGFLLDAAARMRLCIRAVVFINDYYCADGSYDCNQVGSHSRM